MPSTRYTRIEITPDVYRALEAEAILQGKTLKKLASELIMRGISRKALDFVKEAAAVTSESDIELDEERAKVVKKIGATGIYISDQTLVTVREALLDSGYQGAMLHVAQHMASMERDELHRVLAICRRYKLLPQLAAEIVKNLNLIETGRIR
jgi:predicted CopG family antitoxin